MIESAEFRDWLRKNDPDLDDIRAEAKAILAQMDATLSERVITISPLECVALAEASEQIDRERKQNEFCQPYLVLVLVLAAVAVGLWIAGGVQ